MNYFWKHTKCIESVISRAGRVLLLLDFDGTLAPIVSTPNRAKLPKNTKEILEKLLHNQNICLGVVSGRALSDVINKVGINGLIYSGNHGMEWEINRKVYKTYLPLEIIKILKDAKEELEQIKSRFPGILVEDKGLSLALHYRIVPDNERSMVVRLLDERLAKYLTTKQVSLIKGNYTYDLRANCGRTKGDLASELKRKLCSGDDVIIYVGDSTTDEDVFNKLTAGITIKVGKPTGSNAKYYLKDSRDVCNFLFWVSKLSRKHFWISGKV